MVYFEVRVKCLKLCRSKTSLCGRFYCILRRKKIEDFISPIEGRIRTKSILHTNRGNFWKRNFNRLRSFEFVAAFFTEWPLQELHFRKQHITASEIMAPGERIQDRTPALHNVYENEYFNRVEEVSKSVISFTKKNPTFRIMKCGKIGNDTGLAFFLLNPRPTSPYIIFKNDINICTTHRRGNFLSSLNLYLVHHIILCTHYSLLTYTNILFWYY